MQKKPGLKEENIYMSFNAGIRCFIWGFSGPNFDSVLTKSFQKYIYPGGHEGRRIPHWVQSPWGFGYKYIWESLPSRESICDRDYIIPDDPDLFIDRARELVEDIFRQEFSFCFNSRPNSEHISGLLSVGDKTSTIWGNKGEERLMALRVLKNVIDHISSAEKLSITDIQNLLREEASFSIYKDPAGNNVISFEKAKPAINLMWSPLSIPFWVGPLLNKKEADHIFCGIIDFIEGPFKIIYSEMEFRSEDVCADIPDRISNLLTSVDTIYDLHSNGLISSEYVCDNFISGLSYPDIKSEIEEDLLNIALNREEEVPGDENL